MLCLGLATSESVAGFEASRWRSRALLGGLALAVLDIAATCTYDPIVDSKTPGPIGIFWLASTLRYVILCIFDAALAFLIYASATGRFLLFSAPAIADPEVTRRRTEELLTQANVSLQMTQTNLRAYSIARNATVRNPALKATDDEYWRTVVAMEGIQDDSVFDEEEVQAAISQAYGSGTVSVVQIRKDADAFVNATTRGLDMTSTTR